MKLIEGKKYYLKNEGDLMLCSTFRALIKQSVTLEFIRLTKSGLAYVKTNDNTIYNVPQRALMEI